ncbi:response regulator [Sphingomonas sp. CGMCC 1.13654]|uniref:Response regulator n=1 Tax=Sphingomonas chungangi TaxID=2683589 RepID=A0A838LDM0_9SPHN|nr:response regulator [Sphingomonas chungangi]MBA2935598.1 response regulator [Sphingomonas chungangi]MVW54289.1 response regulator [Sphingomonas chungangi]
MFGRGRQGEDALLRRILVVEDDALVAFDAEYGLSDAGFTVVDTVDTADDAERCIAEGGIDLVLADIGLRGERTGIDVARAAHAAGIPLLFVTGHCPAEARGFAAGCLAKPYSQRDLLAAIAAVEAVKAGRKTRRLPKALDLFGD